MDHEQAAVALVRARLLRELGTRLGQNDQLLDLCRTAIQQEGYWTTGSAALSILGEVFAGRDDVGSFLLGLLTGAEWSGFKYSVVPPLLKGFDSAIVREAIERIILDPEQPAYERTQMLMSYYRVKSNDPSVVRFIDGVFENSADASIRAAAIHAKSYYPSKITSDFVGRLRSIAKNDQDAQVRAAAISVISNRKDELDFLVERASEDADEQVRYVATKAIDSLGYNNRDWYIGVFQKDSADFVRGAALDWLVFRDRASIDDRELRDLLIGEMKRAEPRYAASRSAQIALRRWPGDAVVKSAVKVMLVNLPSNMDGWARELRNTLSRLDRKSGSS